jgi:serine/threonine-protein kinase
MGMPLLEQLTIALRDRYRVERELGRGGMAVVLLAEDLKHHRRVALKVLQPELSAALGGERFLREIEIVAGLQHPHILPLFDSGQIPVGSPERSEGTATLLYYVMPYAEGESLRQRLAREGQLPLDAALRITHEVGSALQYAHEHGVIHRDVKPENVMLTAGQAVVTDFGIARALHAAGGESLTISGMVVGTPQYMCPEQAGGAVDGRSDQYSLACVLYEMLVGQPPFTGPSAQAVLARHSLDPVPGVRVVRQAVPAEVEAAILRAMAKTPADRFPSIRQFLHALELSQAMSGAATAPSPRATAGRPRAWRRGAVVLAGALLLAGAGWWLMGRRSDPPGGAPGAVTSIAVLPFRELDANPDSSYLGDGMTEGLIADLSQIGSLKVISRSSGAMAQGSALPLAGRASELGVNALVDGWIRRSGDSVRVSVHLVRAADSTPLLARSWMRRVGELPDLQREMTVAITGAIGAKMGTERSRLAARRAEVDQRAYDAYLRGRFELEQGDPERAKATFEQAERIAPTWAPPLVGLANYYTLLPFVSDVPPAEVLPKARAALAQALELDETLAEAHAASAYIRAYYEWDWRGAEREFRRAIELRPSYADAYFSYARFLASRRRLDEAIAQLGRAIELDPLSLSVQANLALLYYFAGRYREADTRLRAVLKTDSTDVTARWGLALVAEQEGRPADAIAILEPISGASFNRKASLGHAYAVAGRAAEARKVLAELEAASAKSYVPAYWFALLYAGLGRRPEALRALERAYEERSTVLAYLQIDPRLAPLREEPRYVALVRRLSGE